MKFEKLYLAKLRDLNLDIALYQRYIDDLNMALSCLQSRVRFRQGKLVLVPDLVDSDKAVNGMLGLQG